MGKQKKQIEPEEVCRAEADEVKYMMLLNALNESGREADANAPNLENEESEKP